MGMTLLAKRLVASAFTTGTLPTPAYIAWGDGSTAYSEEDTALSNEIDRNAISDTDLSNQTVQYTGILSSSELVGSTIREAGLFDTSSSGNLFVRDTFEGIEKTNGFEVETIVVVRIE